MGPGIDRAELHYLKNRIPDLCAGGDDNFYGTHSWDINTAKDGEPPNYTNKIHKSDYNIRPKLPHENNYMYNAPTSLNIPPITTGVPCCENTIYIEDSAVEAWGDWKQTCVQKMNQEVDRERSQGDDSGGGGGGGGGATSSKLRALSASGF